MTAEENRKALILTKHSLIIAHDGITTIADTMEALLPTEYDMASSKEYGTVCRVLGILEEQITAIGNQLNKNR